MKIFLIIYFLISHSKDLVFSCFSYFYFNIGLWRVKWCSKAGSKRKDAIFLAEKNMEE